MMIDWASIVVSVPLKTSEVLETSEVWHIFIILNPPVAADTVNKLEKSCN